MGRPKKLASASAAALAVCAASCVATWEDSTSSPTGTGEQLLVAKVTSVSYAISPATGVVGQPTISTASSTGSSAPRYRFWAVTLSGQWTQPCGDYGTSNSCTFTPSVAGP